MKRQPSENYFKHYRTPERAESFLPGRWQSLLFTCTSEEIKAESVWQRATEMYLGTLTLYVQSYHLFSSTLHLLHVWQTYLVAFLQFSWPNLTYLLSNREDLLI